MSSYLDTSAAMKLLVVESESAALREHLGTERELMLVASYLLHTELYCAAARHPDDIDLDDVATLLGGVTLVDLTRNDLRSAAGLATLRSNDAVHLAVAQRTGATDMITYDVELARACRTAGMSVTSPA